MIASPDRRPGCAARRAGETSSLPVRHVFAESLVNYLPIDVLGVCRRDEKPASGFMRTGAFGEDRSKGAKQ